MISLFLMKLGNKLNISGYNESSNMRTIQRGEGVAILLKDCFEIKILDVSVKYSC